jgi:diaminopimelate epimerase
MTRHAFVKMQGLGNDFVLIDATRLPVDLDARRIRRLADRRYGIGFDQLLLLEPATRPHALARYRIFNADGLEAEHCGNGIRCVARYLRDAGRVNGAPIALELGGGIAEVYPAENDEFRADMGVPRFDPGDIPLAVAARADRYRLRIDGAEHEFAALSMGNPHAVLRCADVDSAPVAALGPRIETHALFPARVNVGFMQVVDAHRIRLRVFERGVGETPACGTGACAAAVAGIQAGELATPVTVVLRGGALRIDWRGEGTAVWMTGPAERVFEGEIEL